MSKNIYPMAFIPNTDLMCELYYVGFPKKWKDILLQVDCILNPNKKSMYGLPTYALKNSLFVWMDGIVEMTPLTGDSDDTMWIISCDEKIDTEKLFEHILIWLHTYYLSNEKLNIQARDKIQELIEGMKLEELDRLLGNKTVNLFDSNGIPTENYSFSAFSMMVTNKMIGKTIVIDGHEVTLHYAGKNHLISDIQGMNEKAYSYGISFSLQTVPPERKSLLLCDASIHRWIPGTRKPHPYLNKNRVIAHVWGKNHKVYQMPILQKYKADEEFFWEKNEEKYYNIYHHIPLPKAHEVMNALDYYMKDERKITCLYKNGMYGYGFQENKIGTGVSVSEKKDIIEGVFEYIQGMVKKMPPIERVTKTSKIAKKKLCLDDIRFDRELTKEQQNHVAERLQVCTGLKHLNIEVYYREENRSHAEQIMESLENIFQSSEEMAFHLKMCPIKTLADPLESSKSEDILKRIREIDREIELAKEVTACLILLPGKESFKENDPKEAIRCGFALKRRLTQFIIPWEKAKNEMERKEIKGKISSSIEDLCRQLGYIRSLDRKSLDTSEMLVHAPVVGMHVMTQVKTLYGKARFLPVFVDVDYISGKVFVECDAFQYPKIPYYEAAFELAKLSLDKNFEKKCDDASRGMFKQKMMMWKTLYREKSLLVLVEANGNTRALCSGITDGKIKKYEYHSAYRPCEIEVGTKNSSYPINLNDSGVRMIRIRRNGEVPDYYTDLSEVEGHAATSGIFQYGQVYWSIAGRPYNKAYVRSYKDSTYTNSEQNFCERDMIEFYPIQLQEGDVPEDWIYYTNSLRLGFIQYDEATATPIPLHLAGKLQEYILQIKR